MTCLRPLTSNEVEKAEDEFEKTRPVGQVLPATYTIQADLMKRMFDTIRIHEMLIGGEEGFYRVGSIPEEETGNAAAFLKAHNELHAGAREGAIGGRYTYSFTPTSIGTVVTLACACGEKIDLSGLL